MVRSAVLVILLVLSPLAQAVNFVTVTGNKVNVRQGAGPEFAPVAQVNKGQLLLVLEQQGEWSLVFFLDEGEERTEGWIVTRFLKPDRK